MLRIKIPLESIRESAEKAQRELALKRDQILGQLKDNLEDKAEHSFQKRSQGGEDVGITWTPLTAGHLRRKLREGRSPLIGIYTGKMEKSLTARVVGNRIALEYGVTYAVFFDRGATGHGARRMPPAPCSPKSFPTSGSCRSKPRPPIGPRES